MPIAYDYDNDDDDETFSTKIPPVSLTLLRGYFIPGTSIYPFSGLGHINFFDLRSADSGWPSFRFHFVSVLNYIRNFQTLASEGETGIFHYSVRLSS